MDSLAFSFCYRGVDFDAEFHESPKARIVLKADLGQIPYSMESPAGRRLCQRIVKAVENLKDGRIKLVGGQDMHLTAEAVPPMTENSASAVATLTALVLTFAPYLDLLVQALQIPHKK